MNAVGSILSLAILGLLALFLYQRTIGSKA